MSDTPRRSERSNKGVPAKRFSPTFGVTQANLSGLIDDELNATIVQGSSSTPNPNPGYQSDLESLPSINSVNRQMQSDGLADVPDEANQPSTSNPEQLFHTPSAPDSFSPFNQERDMTELVQQHEEEGQRIAEMIRTTRAHQQRRESLEREIIRMQNRPAPLDTRADVHQPSVQLGTHTVQAPQPAPQQRDDSMRYILQLIQQQSENTAALTAQVARLSVNFEKLEQKAAPSAGISSFQPKMQHRPEQQVTCNYSLEQANNIEPHPDQHVLQQRQNYSWRDHELPTFDGRAEDWPIFLDSFNGTIHMFDDFEQMMRLRRSLAGEAKRRVECLLMSKRHVADVINSLELQFGRPDQIVRSQIDRVRNVAPIREGQLDRFAPFAADVKNLAIFLNNNNTRHHLANPTLMDELVLKLPATRQFDWAVQAAKITPYATIQDLAEWLMQVARVACLVPRSSSTSTTYNQPGPRNHQPVPRTSNTQRLPASSANRENIKRNQINHIDVLNKDTNPFAPNCSFCSRAHRISKCVEFRRYNMEDRLREARSRNWCFSCLRAGHSFDNCRCKRVCDIDGCRSTHHPLLHGESDANMQIATPPRTSNTTNESTTVNRPSTSTARADDTFVGQVNDTDKQLEVESTSSVLFRILPVTLYGPNDRQLQTYAMFDEGSSLTLLDASVAAELHIQGPASSLSTECYDGSTSTELSMTVTMEISGASNYRHRMNSVRTTNRLNLPQQTLKMSELHTRYHHLRDLPIADIRNAQPKLLIGLMHSHLGSLPGTSSSVPIATRTKLGWVVFGPHTRTVSRNGIYHCREVDEQSDNRLERVVHDYFTTENFGVMKPERELTSDEDARAAALMKMTTRRLGDRFETGLLWRTNDVNLPESYAMARRRLSAIESRMKRDPVYAKLYNDQISAYIEKGYARKLTAQEAAKRDQRTWYLPHFGVFNQNKPGKFRLVFDAAASVNGTSLNAALLKGPDQNQPLPKVLFQFRQGKIGVCADIREMFHQVAIRLEDQHSQRFLWRKGNTDAEIDTYVMTVMTFGATCSPASAQYVKNLNASEYEQKYPTAARAIKDWHYVDDFVASFATECAAIRISKEITAVHKGGGFELRGFVSNNSQVLRALGNETDQPTTVRLQPDDQQGEKILGMQWETRDDSFVFAMKFQKTNPDVLAGKRPPTKRELLSIAMSVFDPFGILADFMLHTKLIVQDLWRAGVSWDDPVPPSIASKWEAWRVAMQRTKLCRVPRCYSGNICTADEMQLHIFADASESAFAAVGYWRITKNNQHEAVFVMGKTKCAPIKMLSVPRLELQAAVLATRMYNTIRECHPDLRVTKLVMWTDSMTVLRWIQSCHRRFKPFVAHRVAEVLETVGSTPWRWLPTSENVADDATRATTTPYFDPHSRYLRGPAFLEDDEANWPERRIEHSTNDLEEDAEEIRQRFIGVIACRAFVNISPLTKYLRLCRSTAWACRFVHNTIAKVHGRELRKGELLVREVDQARLFLCRVAQIEGFPAEYAALQQNKPINKCSNVLVLMPYLDKDDKVIRLYGRTDAANSLYLPFDAKRPILLPKTHPFTSIVVTFLHEQLMHAHEDATIAAVRQRYWVPHLRALVRRTKRNCQTCRNRSTVPATVVMGQLPIDRITPFVRPFQYTGLDYFGPMLVTIGRRTEKRWAALFTCLTVRAVHLELATDLSTDSCLLCIRNFCNVRGIPTRIRSDNGTNFVGAKNELRRETDFFDFATIQSALSVKGIEWIMNVPGNPEAGGAWERLVQSIKKVLAITLKQVAPRVDTLRGLLIEAANIVNSMPLTEVAISPSAEEPLTPNHFLLGHSNTIALPGSFEPNEMCSRKQWRICQQLKNHFWTRWVNDYLPELTRRTKHHRDVAPLREGDLVLICDPNQARSHWRRGLILRTIIGTDGRVRSAEVKTKDGVLKRPATKLAVLDVKSEDSDNSPHGGRDIVA